MKTADIRKRAKEFGVKIQGVTKADMIRAIQIAEGIRRVLPQEGRRAIR